MAPRQSRIARSEPAAGESATGERATRRGRATAEAFERAARKVIEDKGFLGATIADIAQEAGRSTGSFYNYYDSKEDLLVVWARRFSRIAGERAAPAFAPGVDPRVALRAAVEAHWSTFTDHLAEMVGVSQMAAIDDDFADEWRRLRSVAIKSIAAGIRRAQKDGYCPGLRADVAASAITAMLNQFCFTWLAQGGDGETGRRAQALDPDVAIDTLTDLWYHAVYWRP